MNKVALVTGATGFLGRNLVEALHSQAWRIHVLHRQEAPQWLTQVPHLTCHPGALDDADAVWRAMPPGCDAVFHVAGNTSSWVGDEAALHRDHVVATRHVLDAAIRRSARRLVMTSTLGVFDTSLGVIREQTPLLPLGRVRNPYLRTKIQADQLLDQGEAQGLSVVRMHPAHILGRYDQRGWITLFDQAHAGGLGPAPRGSASFCLASDVALAHVRAATLGGAARRYVLATADASYLTLFKAVARHLGRPEPARTAPNGVLKAVAYGAQWHARLTGRRPMMTPGMADILGADMLAGAELAMADLGLPATSLEVMLQEAFNCWQEAGRRTV